MAQADDSAPRKTTTYKRFEGMASQNERYNTKPDEMFWLENIMRVSPKRLHSVPGPTANLFNPNQPCPETIPHDHESLAQTNCSVIQTGFPPGTISNARASWGRVENGIVIAAIVSAVDPINSIEVLEINVDQGVVIQSLTPIPTPFVGNLMYCGHSDEQSYAFFGGVGGGDSAIWYFSWPQQTVTRFVKANSYSETAERWAKNGIYFYVAQQNGGSLSIQQFSFPGVLQPDGTYTGTFVQKNNTTFDQPTPSDPSFTVLDLQATAAFVYVLVRRSDPDPLVPVGHIYKLSTADLSLVSVFDFDYTTATNTTNNAGPLLMYVADDTMIYTMRSSNLLIQEPPSPFHAIDFGYVDWTNQSYQYIDRVSTGALTCASTIGKATMYFERGNFYYGGSGAPLVGGLVNITQVGPVPCPGEFFGGLLVSMCELEMPNRALKGVVEYASFSIPATNFGIVDYASFKTIGTPDSGIVDYAAFSLPAPVTEIGIVKQADTTNSTTTLMDDPELTFAIGANETWVIHYALRAKPDVDGEHEAFIGLNVPAGATGLMIDYTFGYITQDFTSPGSIELFSFGILVVCTVVNGSTAGNVTLQFAEAFSGFPATLSIGCSLMAYKV